MKDFPPPAAVERRSAREIVAGSGSSFLAGMRALPRRRRDSIFAVYAFCRVVDDIADGPGADADKLARLEGWAEEIDRVYEGRPQTPLGAELMDAVIAHSLPKEEFHLIVDGMRMDTRPMVAPSTEELDRYIRRVAGAVGMLSMRVFGAWRGEPSRRFALGLSRAMQITNILRDVEEDAARGRIYLPAELLKATGLPADPARLPYEPRLGEARRRLGSAARASFRAAAREVPRHDRLRLLPALMMMGPYERLLRRMERDWSRPIPPRTKWLKLADAIGGAARAVSIR